MAAHFVTVGATQILVENLWERIARTGGFQFSHIVHPIMDRQSWGGGPAPPNIRFMGAAERMSMPDPDAGLLASLERKGVPTIHNMIMSDRVVSKLPYREALAYSTFLVQSFMTLYQSLQPTAIIGSFDALHGSLAMAVAKKMGLPWFALNFSVIPPGYACFCERLSPSARVDLGDHHPFDMRDVADTSFAQFEARGIQAPAYITPSPLTFAANIARLPHRGLAFWKTARKARRREFLKFVEEPGGYDALAALRRLRRTAKARSALSMTPTVSVPPDAPYAFFGLHMQPESTIDVWAPFFSNQMWIVELFARSVPPSHKLMVKIHKSDAANYSREQLDRMRSFPGVELVAPFADTRRFVENADLLFSIQGTIGLEGALLGKPIIVLGDSPVNMFPSASPMGRIAELPELIRQKLAESVPARNEILAAHREFLKPFAPAGHNDWDFRPNEAEINGYVRLFSALSRHLQARNKNICTVSQQ
jgi:Capsule polysaccharide biosynthesis protein